jgi:two-component SAPR family response regulator
MINAARVGRWLRERNLSPLGDPLLADFFSSAEQITQELALVRKKQLKSVSKTLEPTQYEFFTFGTMRALKDGYELRSSDWQTREAKELFFFLLQAPPMTKDEIGLVFWPDITPARLKMRFKINVYRIRQALGQDVIVFDGEKYQFNKTIHYTWDREVFDALLKDARDAPTRLHILPDVMALVKGQYMEDSDLDWAVLDRLRYNEKIQQTMVDLSDAYLIDGQLEECIQVAWKILTFDSLMEDGHRLLLLAYAAQHDQAKVVRHFQKYEKTLDDELGIRPSAEFLALYDGLMEKF